MNEELTMENMAKAVVHTAMTAKKYVDESDFDESQMLVCEFLAAIDDAGLAVILSDWSDFDKIECGMYAANLYLAACAKIAKHETARLKKASALENTFKNS